MNLRTFLPLITKYEANLIQKGWTQQSIKREMKLLEENINDPPMTKFQRYGLATFFTMMAGPVGLFVAVDWEKDRTSAQQRYEVFASKI